MVYDSNRYTIVFVSSSLFRVRCYYVITLLTFYQTVSVTIQITSVLYLISLLSVSRDIFKYNVKPLGKGILDKRQKIATTRPLNLIGLVVIKTKIKIQFL